MVFVLGIFQISPQANHVVINEVYSRELEWIEIYNPTNSPVNISNWNLTVNGISYTFQNLELGAKSYYTVTNHPAKGVLWSNVSLLDSEENLVDEITLSKNLDSGYSYARKCPDSDIAGIDTNSTDDWYVSSSPTFNSKNDRCFAHQISVGENSPQSHTWYLDSEKPYNEMLQLKLVGYLKLLSITLKASGSGDDVEDISRVDLVVDSNGNGFYDSEEAILTFSSYSQDNGVLTLSIPEGYEVSSGTTIALLIVYKMTSYSTEGSTYSFKIIEIDARDETDSMLQLPNLPIQSPIKTVGGSQNLPDLMITRIRITQTDSFYEISYTIKNQGEADASLGSNYSSILFIDDKKTATDSFEETLKPGESLDRKFPYSWTPTPGSHKIKICADGFNSIQESNEQNNCSTYVMSTENQPPLAFIDSVTPNPASEDEPITFVGHGIDSDGIVVAYQWSSSIDQYLGNTQSLVKNLSPGIHIIYFKVQDDDGVWSQEVSIKVTVKRAENKLPVAEAGEDIVGNEGDEFEFDASQSFDPDGEIVKYVWDFGDKSHDTGIKVTHSFSPGTYTVTLTVFDDKGGTSKDTLTVTVLKKPDVSLKNLSFSSENPMEGDSIAIGVTVTNTGQKTSCSVKFYWDLKNAAHLISSKKIEIGENEKVDVKVQWKAREGIHKIYGVLENCSPEEVNATDNEVSKRIEVEKLKFSIFTFFLMGFAILILVVAVFAMWKR